MRASSRTSKTKVGPTKPPRTGFESSVKRVMQMRLVPPVSTRSLNARGRSSLLGVTQDRLERGVRDRSALGGMRTSLGFAGRGGLRASGGWRISRRR
ncbi:hypothetical protein BCR35DRAFT_41512 [Leucosporidium creatinivorum]|uniref:Uncharacterized protein n=1 Tax=Leucosporidium creatinivorum TaxID=106004 RepID=A0A1Y2C5I4_9BASI|nr:hypothetical protein BCR35DRAFT_41512 [Leucosporidium creatinivorum]